MTELTTTASNELTAHDRNLLQRAAGYVEGSRAKNTRDKQASMWADFVSWAGSESSAFQTTIGSLVLYFTERAETLGIDSLELRKWAITQTFKASNRAVPWDCLTPREALEWRKFWEGLRRSKAGPQGKAALTGSMLSEILKGFEDGDTLKDLRDRAILLVGYFGCLRRSELAALQLADIEYRDRGMIIHIRQSKTDQTGQGTAKPVMRQAHRDTRYRPVHALQTWIDRADIKDGSLWRGATRGGGLQGSSMSPKAVERVVKTRCKAVGINASLFGAHSLRSGAQTTAAEGGATMADLRNLGGYSERSRMPARYVRAEDSWKSAAKLKL